MTAKTFAGTNDRTIHTYGCKKCKTYVAGGEHLASSAFRARKGQGYLFHAARNVKQSEKTESVAMTTGQNVIRLLNCQTCDAYLGWTYDRVPSPDQEYKLNKFLLEVTLLCYM